MCHPSVVVVVVLSVVIPAKIFKLVFAVGLSKSCREDVDAAVVDIHDVFVIRKK